MSNFHIQHNDEIDLIALIKLLWNKKIWIILTAFITTVLAGIYAFTAKEQWTSKAQVILPTYSDLGGYLQLRNEYSRILGTLGTKDNARDIGTEVIKEVFNRFSQLAQSVDERKEFFINSDIYKLESEGKDEQGRRKILSQLINDATIFTYPDPKKEPNVVGNRISFYAETPILAQDTLKAFIGFINAKAYTLELNDFLVIVGERIRDLKYEQQLIGQDLLVNKTVQLENLNKAYDIATKAGIREYTKVFNSNGTGAVAASLSLTDTRIPLSDSKLSDGTYLFMLGEKYLKAQIDVVNTDKLIYPPRYYQIAEQLKQLEPLFEKAKEVKGQTYSYLSSPDYPVSKDAPQRLLILLLAAFVGSIIGVIGILIKRLA